MYSNDIGNVQELYPICPIPMQRFSHMQWYSPQPMLIGPTAEYSSRQAETSGISPTMQKVINDLIQSDFNSAYLYLAMSNYLNRIDLSGFGSFLRAQHT